tara:strand:+ start:1033 stop:1140 length:108 start_codon:yes stop_codon:yes gene_type:complete
MEAGKMIDRYGGASGSLRHGQIFVPRIVFDQMLTT